MIPRNDLACVRHMVDAVLSDAEAHKKVLAHYNTFVQHVASIQQARTLCFKMSMFSFLCESIFDGIQRVFEISWALMETFLAA